MQTNFCFRVDIFLTWYNRHVTGAFLLIFGSLPSIVTASLVCLTLEDSSGYRRDMFVAVLCSSALHHTNFSNLSSIMRTFLAFIILCTAFFISTYDPPNVSILV